VSVKDVVAPELMVPTFEYKPLVADARRNTL